MSPFGQRLRKLRNKRNVTQKDLAKRFKISESAIGMYERGEREPSFELVRSLADFFDCTVDYLLGRTDDPSPGNKLSTEKLSEQFPILADIDPELLQKFAETIKEDPYQMLMFDDILSASKEEREQIVRDWLELRKKYKNKPKEEPPEDNGPSAWDIIRNNKK